MTVASYDLFVDWADNGNFTDPGDDVSADWCAADIDRGYASPLARVARTGRATFTLRNTSQAYSPELEANVVPSRQVKFEMTYDGNTVTLFRGFLENIRPASGIRGRDEVLLDCVDGMAFLDIFEGRLGIQRNVYADDIISNVVDDVYTPPATNYQDGLNLFPTSGERWALSMKRAPFQAAAQEKIRASQKILDACVSDWGRFFIAKDGTVTYFNRHQMPLDDTVDLTLDDDMQGLSYSKPATEVRNHVTVTYLPRKVGQKNEVLGQFAPEGSLQVKPLRTETYEIPFREPSNQALEVGGLNVITPVSGTDYMATDDDAGEGNDVTSNLSVTFTAYADHAEITIENTDNATDAFIQFLQVRGQVVRTREPETIQVRDTASIDAHEQRHLPTEATLMSNTAQAQSLADYLLDVYKDPQPVVRGVQILGNESATFMAAVRDLELMDKVDLSETQTGLSNFQGHIFRLRHRIPNSREHWLTFDVEQPYDVGTPFFLGDALDSGHVMIY